jgi:hypothetical protein
MDMVPFQILTYHLALENKADPDFPRNILKAVTVKPNRALVILVALLVRILDICVFIADEIYVYVTFQLIVGSPFCLLFANQMFFMI